MDELRLSIAPWLEDSADGVLRIRINEVDLVDLVQPVELPCAEMEGHPDIGGKYDGLRVADSAAGEWKYDGFGPFRFDRTEYDAELTRIDALLLSRRRT